MIMCKFKIIHGKTGRDSQKQLTPLVIIFLVLSLIFKRKRKIYSNNQNL